MTDNPNEVTVDNSLLILIDHQPWVGFAVNSIDPSLLSNNLEGLASSAKALDVPVILTTVGAEGGKLRDPLMRAVADVFPDKIPIDRTSTNAWADIREAVEATGRKTLLMAGLWTEVCLAQTAIAALANAGTLAAFVAVCTAMLVLRRREPDRPRPFRAWGYPWSAGIVLAGAAAFLVGAVIGDPINAGAALALTAVGFAVRWLLASPY